MGLDGGGWSWVEVGAQFSNTHNKSNLLLSEYFKRLSLGKLIVTSPLLADFTCDYLANLDFAETKCEKAKIAYCKRSSNICPKSVLTQKKTLHVKNMYIG